MIAVYTPAPLQITVDLFQKMGDAGVLTKADHVELIEGEILEMPPIGTRHASVTGRLNKWLTPAVGHAAIVRLGNPVSLGKYSQPEPDLLLLKPRLDDYVVSHPGPDDVLLLVEVADSTLEFDRGMKRDLYARFGVREYWVVDVNDRCVFTHSDPKKRVFETTRELHSHDMISPLAFPQIKIAVRELFPQQ